MRSARTEASSTNANLRLHLCILRPFQCAAPARRVSRRRKLSSLLAPVTQGAERPIFPRIEQPAGRIRRRARQSGSDRSEGATNSAACRTWFWLSLLQTLNRMSRARATTALAPPLNNHVY